MGYTAAAKNGMLDGQPLRQRVTHLSLHTQAAPAGGSEVTGNGYARVSVSASDFAAATAGTLTLNNDKAFSGPANGSATHFGAWDGATFLGDGPISGDTSLNAAGEFVLKSGTSFDLNA